MCPGKPSSSRSAWTAAVTLLERLNRPCLGKEEKEKKRLRRINTYVVTQITFQRTDSGFLLGQDIALSLCVSH